MANPAFVSALVEVSRISAIARLSVDQPEIFIGQDDAKTAFAFRAVVWVPVVLLAGDELPEPH